MSDLAVRLKTWRHALGLTQDEFARRSGLPKRTIVGYENSEREPGAAALAAIAKTGVNMTWLLTGEGEMLPPKQEKTESHQIDGVSLDALAGRHARRWAKIIELIESAPTPEEAEAVIEEFYARARQAAELAELRQAVKALTAAQKKTA